MNNKEFIAELARRNQLSLQQTKEFVIALSEIVAEELSEGDQLLVPNFGTYEVKKKMERIIVNPGTGLRQLVPPKLALTFKPAPILKEKLK